MEYLFVGGPVDDKRSRTGDRDCVRVVTQSLRQVNFADDLVKEKPINYHPYYREVVYLSDKSWIGFYRHFSLTLKQAILRVFENYPEEKTDG